MEAVKTVSAGFQIRSSLARLTTVSVSDSDVSGFALNIQRKIRQAPHFFNNTPVVIDFKFLDEELEGGDLSFLCDVLKRYSMVPVGVRTQLSSLIEQAHALGIAVFQDLPDGPTEQDSERTRVVETPVRSGQQIYASRSDLIVEGQVSSGAELLADGHIHVYNTCRGRLLAGVNGDHKSIIFCQSLEAELISIAGHYLMSDDIPKQYWKQSVKIQLSQDKLIFQRITR